MVFEEAFFQSIICVGWFGASVVKLCYVIGIAFACLLPFSLTNLAPFSILQQL